MCPKCKGGGIIGAGERPWEKAGHTGTCDLCGGTGKVEDGVEYPAADAGAPVEKTPDEEAQKEETVAGGGEEITFKEYKVIAEEGFTTAVFGHLAKDSIIKLNPLNENVIASVADGTLEEVVENAVV